MNAALVDQNGKLRNAQAFKEKIQEISKDYNQNYLQAERQNALRSAQASRDWQKYQDNKDLFPNLMYMTIADERVRKEHQALHGIVKPVDDPFWDSYYPPNGWRCRCYVKPTSGKTTTTKPAVKPDKGFSQNVGKTGRIFSPENPYNSIPKADIKTYHNAFEVFKINGPTVKLKGVKISVFADKTDLKSNIKNALILHSSFKKDIRIEPHINRTGWKNPELSISGTKADIKQIRGYKGIQSGLSASKKQGATITVFNLDKISKIDLSRIQRQLTGKINKDRGLSVKGVYFVHEKKAVYLSREMIVKGDFSSLKKLKGR